MSAPFTFGRTRNNSSQQETVNDNTTGNEFGQQEQQEDIQSLGQRSSAQQQAGQQSTNQTNQQSFYAPATGNINRILELSAENYDARANAGQRYLGFNEAEQESQGLISQLARNNGLNQSAAAQAQSEINGDYLGQDAPGQAQLREGVRRGVTQQLNDTFSRAGRTGSAAHQDQLAEGLSRGLGQIDYGQYQQERDRQVQARGAAGGLQSNLYNDASVIGSVGQQQRSLAQQQRDFALDGNQQYLNDYLANSGGIAGLAGSSTGSQQQQNSQISLLSELQRQQEQSYGFGTRQGLTNNRRIGNTTATGRNTGNSFSGRV